MCDSVSVCQCVSVSVCQWDSVFINYASRIFSFFCFFRIYRLFVSQFSRCPALIFLRISSFSCFIVSLFSLFSEKCISSWLEIPSLYRSLCLSLVLSFSIFFSLSSLLGAPSRYHGLSIKLSFFLSFPIFRCLLFSFQFFRFRSLSFPLCLVCSNVFFRSLVCLASCIELASHTNYKCCRLQVFLNPDPNF